MTDVKTRQHEMNRCLRDMQESVVKAKKYCNLAWCGSCNTERCGFSNAAKFRCELAAIDKKLSRV